MEVGGERALAGLHVRRAPLASTMTARSGRRETVGIESLASDVLAIVFSLLDKRSLGSSRLVCKQWASVGRREEVLLSLAQSMGTMSGIQLRRLLPPITMVDLQDLPRRPSISHRGTIYWQYGPLGVRAGLAIVRTRAKGNV